MLNSLIVEDNQADARPLVSMLASDLAKEYRMPRAQPLHPPHLERHRAETAIRQKSAELEILNEKLLETVREKIVISAEPLPDGMIRITIQDTGIGIKQEDMETLFETFYQLDMSTTKNTTGMGVSSGRRASSAKATASNPPSR